MQHNPKAYFHDIIKSCDFIIEYTTDVNYEKYLQNRMIQDAVERNFITIGKALNRLKNENPELIAKISDSRKIIAFRNIVVHAYDAIEDAVVWDIVQSGIKTLKEDCQKLLNSQQDAGE